MKAAAARPVAPRPARAATQVKALQRQIGRVRRTRRTVWLAGGGSRCLTVLLAVLGGEAVLDWLVELPWPARALALLAALGSGGYFIWRDAARPFRKRLD